MQNIDIAKNQSNKRKLKSILVTLPKPASGRSPYYDLAAKYNVELTFFPFISVEGLTSKEFRQQNVNILDYSAVILVSRNAVDHFFRICEELKIKIPQSMKYFCASKAVALYLQKFITYRKRKVFYSEDGSSEQLLESLRKQKVKEKFIFPVSEHTKNDLSPVLKEEEFDFKEIPLYRTVNNDISEAMAANPDLIVFFSPFSVDTLFEYDKNFKQGDMYIAAFGSNTCQAVRDNGLRLDIEAPQPEIPSMSDAIIHYFENQQ